MGLGEDVGGQVGECGLRGLLGELDALGDLRVDVRLDGVKIGWRDVAASGMPPATMAMPGSMPLAMLPMCMEPPLPLDRIDGVASQVLTCERRDQADASRSEAGIWGQVLGLGVKPPWRAGTFLVSQCDIPKPHSLTLYDR